jgi:rRNA maturation protein Nop10
MIGRTTVAVQPSRFSGAWRRYRRRLPRKLITLAEVALYARD